MEEAERYWRGVVGPEPVFLSASLERHRPATVRLNTGQGYHGCLSLRVLQGSVAYRRIAGAWEGVVAGCEACGPPSSSG